MFTKSASMIESYILTYGGLPSTTRPHFHVFENTKLSNLTDNYVIKKNQFKIMYKYCMLNLLHGYIMGYTRMHVYILWTGFLRWKLTNNIDIHLDKFSHLERMVASLIIDDYFDDLVKMGYVVDN